MNSGPISQYLEKHFRHFNAAAVIDAAQAYQNHLNENGKMMVTVAGAMSTAEIGLSLAEMIRQDKVHAISCTGANMEEDLFNLVAHNSYKRVPNYRDLTPADEEKLAEEHLARVTDTCIPEEAAMRKIERLFFDEWKKASDQNTAKLPHEFLYDLAKKSAFDDLADIDPKDSWILAAAEKNLPLFVPGWEDSTLGNNFVARCIKGEIENPNCVKSGLHYMIELTRWYEEHSSNHRMGFFQLGGGIAGDFPICVVPMINYDIKRNVPVWSYFCQISDSTTSYGSYSGAVPNEKITWGKLERGNPHFIIESDATIVAPLVFAHILGW